MEAECTTIHTADYLNKIKRSVRHLGICTPVVLKTEGGRLIVVSGNTRVLCAQDLDIPLPVIVGDNENRFPHLKVIPWDQHTRKRILALYHASPAWYNVTPKHIDIGPPVSWPNG